MIYNIYLIYIYFLRQSCRPGWSAVAGEAHCSQIPPPRPPE